MKEMDHEVSDKKEFQQRARRKFIALFDRPESQNEMYKRKVSVVF